MHTQFAGRGANMKRLGDLGLEVHITELDINVFEGIKPCTQELLNARPTYADIWAPAFMRRLASLSKAGVY